MKAKLRYTFTVGAYLAVAALIIILGNTFPTIVQGEIVHDSLRVVTGSDGQMASRQSTTPGGTVPGTIPGADLQLTVTDSGQTTAPAGTIVYTLNYANNDPTIGSTGVVLSETVPDKTTFNAAASAPTAWSCADGSPAGTTCTTNIGSLAAGAAGSATFAVTVDSVLHGALSTIDAASIADDGLNGFDPNLSNNFSTTTSALGTVCSPACDLYATTGQLTLPGGAGTVPIWGYTTVPGGPADLPGPVLIANQGDTITVNLHNNLGEATSLDFQGQSMMPDMVGAAANGGATSYTFTVSNPGTIRYEAGLTPNVHHQVAMGMFGALIVRPTDTFGAPIPNQAYSDPSTAFDQEALLVLSEIDPSLNNSPNPATFDLRGFTPRYWLINGKAYPDTAEIVASAGDRVLLRYINAGLQHHVMGLLGMDQTLLSNDGSPLKYQHKVVAETIAAGQSIDAIATVPASANPDTRFAVYDTNLLLHNNGAAGFGGMLTFIATPPGVTGFGDMMGPYSSAPVLTPASTDGTVDVTVTTTVSDAGLGDSNILAAEYFIDTTGVPGSGTPMAPQDIFDSPTEGAVATIPAATVIGLTSGNHTVYVRGQDDMGNWGPFNLSVLHVDNAGPATTALVTMPNPTSGNQDVHLSGTANDVAYGNSNIQAAEYFIDTPGADGAGVPMAVNIAAPIASVDATIPSAVLNTLIDGSHTVYVHSQDAFGHWGPVAQVSLVVDRTGPTTSNVTAAPNPNNGHQGVSASQPSVRVDATVSDNTIGMAAVGGGLNNLNPNAVDSRGVDSTLGSASGEAVSRIFMPFVVGGSSVREAGAVEAAFSPATDGMPSVAAVEGFIDTIGPDGSGFPFTPSDGLFGEATEDAYVFIPLPNISLLSDGDHTIYVHGRDSVGNWGSFGSTILTIDANGPTVTAVNATPNPTNAAPQATLTANASDAATNIVAAEWFEGIDPGPGNATPMLATDGAFDSPNEGLTAVVDVTVMPNGDHTLYVRAKDAAGNWSTTASVVLTVSNPPPPLADALYFSTIGGTAIPGVAGPFDDADIYTWDGIAGFGRHFDATASGLPGNADIDGLVMVSPNQFYVSFNRNGGTNVPGVGTVQDEDIVFYDNGVWSLYFDGLAAGLPNVNAADVDAFDIVGGILYFSTIGKPAIPGVPGPYDDADIYTWDGTTFGRAFDASANGLPGNADVDGIDWVGPTQFYLSFNRNGGTNVPGVGTVQDESVVAFNAGTWTLFFDGGAFGLNTTNAQDVDAISIP